MRFRRTTTIEHSIKCFEVGKQRKSIDGSATAFQLSVLRYVLFQWSLQLWFFALWLFSSTWSYGAVFPKYFLVMLASQARSATTSYPNGIS